jgi:uncharacterized membrane protein
VKLKTQTLFILAVVIYGLLYSLISLVNHYNFRTYALDLGAYTNALYDYVHFRWNDSTVFKEIQENLLADHFDLYLILFSPFVLIFKTYTLLILQIFFILLGGLGVYRYFSISKSISYIPLFAAIYFYSFFGVFSAVSFDYHSNVVAASLVPWFFYYFKLKKFRISVIIFILLLISKENISLWIAFICLGSFFEYKNDKKSVYYLLTFALGAMLYYVIITSFVMPWISNGGKYPHFNYSVLGNNSLEAIKYLVLHPFAAVKMLFINHTNNPLGDYVKVEMHILIFVSGVYILFKKPHFILMLVPVYFQKLFNDDYGMWGIGAQYSIEFAPILAIGIFSVLQEIKNKILFRIITIMIMAGVLCSTFRVMDHTVFFTNKSKIRIYKESHYKRDYNVKLVHEQLNKIPVDAKISSQSPFLPHLALRDKIYQFPIIKDAEYIIYSNKEETYPLEKDAFYLKVQELMNTKNWEETFKSEDIVILKRIKS